MLVYAYKTLREFWERHADAEKALRAWHAEAESAEWRSPADITERYPSASILKGNRVVFNIKGNRYRLIAEVDYERQALFIRFLDTHAEYDKVNAEEV